MSHKHKQTRYIIWNLIRVKSSPRHRYGVALLLSLLALGLARWLGSAMEQSSFSLFLTAVMVSTWYGGLVPGLLTTFLTAVTGNYYLLPSASTFRLDLNCGFRL